MEAMSFGRARPHPDPVPVVSRDRPHAKAPGMSTGVAVDRPGPVGRRSTPADLIRLQRLAGNGAVSRLFGRLSRAPVVQRVGSGSVGGSINWRGQVLTKDPVQLNSLLASMIATRGEPETETFAYSFLRMTNEDKFRLELSGVGPKDVAEVQSAFEPVLAKYQKEQETYLARLGPAVVADTRTVLAKSKELLKAEEVKYTDTFPAQQEKPDLEALRTAAKALAAKRRIADTAAAKAQAANRTMVDQRAAPASPMSPFPQPNVPYFPDPKLRDAAGQANDAWWKLEQEYGRLRKTSEQKFPVLAMYSANEDGGAADRLEDLPTWGPLADWRMKGKIVDECRRRLMNVEEAQQQLDEPKAWQLRKMLDATLKQRNATPYQQRWAHDNAAKLAAKEAEAQPVIIGVTIAVVVVTAVATGGAALAVEGSMAAGLFSTLAAGGTAFSAGMSIAKAYEDIQDYQFKKAATATDLDAANSISKDEPTLKWVALDLLAAGLDIAAAGAAFKVAAKAIRTLEAGTEVTGALRAIESAGGTASGKIIGQVLAETSASGALERAIVAEGKNFTEGGLARMGELIEEGLGRTWSEEYSALKARNKVLPFTQEGLEGALGKRTAKKLMAGKDYEKTIGMYHPDLGKAFVRPAAEGDLAGSIAHEMTHAIQGPVSGKYGNFVREFEAYATQRRVMQHLNRTYGWQPKSSAWLLNANDWQVAKHVRLEYGFPVPPWVLEEPLAAKQLDKAFNLLTKRLALIPVGPP